MEVGDIVENVLWQRPVDRNEQNITIQSCLIGVSFLNPSASYINVKTSGGGAAFQVLRHEIDLKASNIARAGIEKPVEVMRFHTICIHQKEVRYSDAGECFCNDAAYAANPHNTDSETRKEVLLVLSPGINGAAQTGGASDWCHRGRIKAELEALAYNSDLVAPHTIELLPVPTPESGAPNSVPANGKAKKWQSGGPGWRCDPVAFGNDVFRAHPLPAAGGMTVHKRNAHVRLARLPHSSGEVCRFEAHVAVQIPFAVQGSQEFGDDAGRSRRAGAWAPKCETEILLPFAAADSTEEVFLRLFGQRLNQNCLEFHSWPRTRSKCRLT